MGLSASMKPVVDALEYFGAKADTLQEYSGLEPEALVLPENMRNLAEIFNAIQSQWRWHNGQVVGLDYAGVRAYLVLSQKSLSKTDFARLQYLEILCLKIENCDQKP